MIDKLNTWIGLWMGILTLILGLVSVWQYFKINKYEERIEKLETNNQNLITEIKNKENKIEDNFSKHIKELEQQQADYEDKLNADFRNRSKEHRYSTLENRMTSVLLCLSSIPDPQLLSSTSDRKKQLVFYMRLMSNHFAKYIYLIRKENLKNESTEDVVLHLPMMLLNLRLALVRIHGISKDFELHIFFFNLTSKIKYIEDVVRGKLIINDDIINEVESIYGDFNELISLIENSRD